MLEKLIRKELQSAKLLKNKKCYQSRYNYLIRLVLLSEYYRGNYVSTMSVHGLVNSFLINEGFLTKNEIREIIQSRHQMKYNFRDPKQNTSRNLEFAISKLEQRLAEYNKN
jgi:hypothetical protein